MSKKRTTYSAEFKTKVVLEALRDDLTLAQCASKHNVTTKNISYTLESTCQGQINQ
ncbi:MAG: transposase [Francisellaceae bacterium]